MSGIDVPENWLQEHVIDKLDIRVPEGALVGQPLTIEPFQQFLILETLFNPVCRRAIFSFPRKNGKTSLASVIAILASMGFGKRITQNGLICVAARSRKQASILYQASARIIHMSRILSTMYIIRDGAKEILCLKNNSTISAISSESTTAHGLSPAITIHDELGQVRGSVDPLYDALDTASGAHESPLSLILSTQAPLDNSLLSMLIDGALRGNDPSNKCFLYSATDDDDIFDEEVWFRVNPALGKFRSYTEFKEMAEQARQMPSREMTFRHYYLNMRIDSANSIVSPDIWRKNGRSPEPALLYEKDVSLGLDLSARQDLTAAVLSLVDDDGYYHVFSHFWMPEDNIDQIERASKSPYRLWVQQGFITAIPGNSIRYDFVAKWIEDIYTEYNLTSIRFDRWRINDLKNELEELGLYLDDIMVSFGQGFKDMSPAVDNFEALLTEGRVLHGNHPVLTMCVANTAIVKDAAGNRKADKAKSVGKIDGLIAMLQSMAGAPANSMGSDIPIAVV